MNYSASISVLTYERCYGTMVLHYNMLYSAKKYKNCDIIKEITPLYVRGVLMFSFRMVRFLCAAIIEQQVNCDLLK